MKWLFAYNFLVKHTKDITVSILTLHQIWVFPNSPVHDFTGYKSPSTTRTNQLLSRASVVCVAIARLSATSFKQLKRSLERL